MPAAAAAAGTRRRHPPSLKSPNAILELSDAKFAWIFGVILTDESRGTETSHVSPTMDLRVCQMKRRERAPQPTCFLIMRYYFSHDHASCLFFFFRQFAQVPHLVPRRPRSVDDIERKQFKFGKHYASHDEVKICMGSYVWRFVTPMFRLLPQNFWFELFERLYRVRNER